jgi:proline iminopeptidase
MSNAPKLTGWMKDHIDRYIADPEKGHIFPMDFVKPGLKVKTLLLTTTGRKSGEPRLLPLIYEKVGEGYVIIASKGGAPEHPAWYLNLEADSTAHIQVVAEHMDVTGRVATGDERSKLWDLMVEAYPPYTEYQESTTREIPVVVLDPK